MVISIEVKEHKLLNSMHSDELHTMGFVRMYLLGTFDISFSNGGTNNSYGCKDYLPTLFKDYLEDILLLNEGCDDIEEIESLGHAISNEE